MIFSNIWEIGVFPDCKVRKPLSYAVKQIVIQELETARLQRAARMNGEITESAKNEKKTVQSSTPWSKSTPVVAPVVAPVATPSQSTSEIENIPNHLRQLNPVQIDPSTVDKVGFMPCRIILICEGMASKCNKFNQQILT